MVALRNLIRLCKVKLPLKANDKQDPVMMRTAFSLLS